MSAATSARRRCAGPPAAVRRSRPRARSSNPTSRSSPSRGQSARRRVPALRDVPRSPGWSTAPRRSRPTASSCSARPRSPASGWRPASACTASPPPAGVGKVMAEWIVDGVPEYDVSHMDIRRFGAHAASRSWATAKALDAYSRYYDIVYPGEEWQAARPLRRSATWPRLSALDASLGEKAGWERVNWFGAHAADGRRDAAAGGLGRSDLVARDRGRGAGDHVRRPGCSTSRRSRSSTSAAAARPRSCNGCAPTTWTSRREPSSTPSCSTSAPASRPT